MSAFSHRLEPLEPLPTTQNDEAKLVVQDAQSYENIKQTLAWLKILALGRKDSEQRKLRNVDDFLVEFADLDRKEKIR